MFNAAVIFFREYSLVFFFSRYESRGSVALLAKKNRPKRIFRREIEVGARRIDAPVRRTNRKSRKDKGDAAEEKEERDEVGRGRDAVNIRA